MKLIKQVKCSGQWKDWHDQVRPCAETNPNTMVQCNAVSDPGCALYFCYLCLNNHINKEHSNG